MASEIHLSPASWPAERRPSSAFDERSDRRYLQQPSLISKLTFKDQWALADRLMLEHGRALAQRLHYFDAFLHNELAHRVLNTGIEESDVANAEALRAYLGRLSDLDEDVAIRFDELSVEGPDAVLQNQASFKRPLSRTLVSILIRGNGGKHFCLKHADEIDGGTTTLSRELLETAPEYFWMHLQDLFPKAEDSTEFCRGLTQYEQPTLREQFKYCDQAHESRRYSALRRLCVAFEAYDETLKAHGAEWLREHMAHHDWMAAHDLLDILDQKNFGAGLSDQERQAISDGWLQEKTRRERRPENTIHPEHTAVLDQMVMFYLGNALRFEARSMEDALLRMEINALVDTAPARPLYARQRREQEMRLQALKKILYRLQEDIDQDEKEITHWLREYLVHAVYRELDFQDKSLHDRDHDVDLPYAEDQVDMDKRVDSCLRFSTDEEIRQYLHAAQRRFDDPEWESSFGGHAWSVIAETAEDLWRPDSLKSIAIDHAFDLEHNGGSVFNKHWRRAQQSPFDKAFLDIKRDIVSLDDLWNKIQIGKPRINPATHSTLERRYGAWRKASELFETLSPAST